MGVQRLGVQTRVNEALSRATLKYPWKNFFGKLHRANFLSLAGKKWEEKNSANKAFEMLNSNSLGKTASK